MELVAVVISPAVFLQFTGQRQRVAVNFQPLINRQHVFGCIKISSIGQNETQGIADTAIAFNDALEDFVRNRQFTGVVGRCRPQTEDFRAHFVGNLLRGNDVALRFRHLVALAIDHKTVGEQRLVGRAAINRTTGKQRRLEPAAMLVGAFKIKISRVSQISRVRTTQDMPMRRTGVEPDVERVLHLDVLIRFSTQQLSRIEFEPGFNAFFFNAQGDLFDQFSRARMRQRSFLVQEERNWHTPVALTGNAPIRTRPHHCFQTCSPPGREELGFIDGALGNPAQGRGILVLLVLHADKPLSGCTEYDRCLVTPAMRVAVLDSFTFKQSTAAFQFLENQWIGFPDSLAGQLANRHRRGIT